MGKRGKNDAREARPVAASSAAGRPRARHRPPDDATARHAVLDRVAVFARDGWTCVYCGTEGTAETLSVDHLQPRVKRGDRTGGNLVTACLACNRLKGHLPLAAFLLGDPARLRNFRARAQYVWPRLLRSVETELTRRRGATKPPRRPPADPA